MNPGKALQVIPGEAVSFIFDLEICFKLFYLLFAFWTELWGETLDSESTLESAMPARFVSEVGLLQDLEMIFLAGVPFEGTISTWIGNLSSLCKC